MIGSSQALDRAGLQTVRPGQAAHPVVWRLRVRQPAPVPRPRLGRIALDPVYGLCRVNRSLPARSRL